jgi:hypothetical protein
VAIALGALTDQSSPSLQRPPTQGLGMALTAWKLPSDLPIRTVRPVAIARTGKGVTVSEDQAKVGQIPIWPLPAARTAKRL